MAEQANQEQKVSLGDSSVEIANYERYKGIQGNIDRVAIMSPTLYATRVHYRREAKDNRIVKCMSVGKPGEAGYKKALCCEKLQEAEYRFSLVVYKYLTDNKGNLVDDTKCMGSIMLWALSEDRYQKLSTLHKQWPILDKGWVDLPDPVPPGTKANEELQHDLLIECTEAKFQKMTFVPCPNAHWRKKKKWYDVFQGKLGRAMEKARTILARPLTDDELKDLFGMGAAVPGTSPTKHAGDVNIDDILD